MASFGKYYQRVKNAVHAVQALAVFVAWAIVIAILTKGGTLDGRIWYYFALCWCCIPAFLYQTATPVFPRIRRFSNIYVHAIIDIVYTILWLAAFACLIAWVKQGSHAAKDWKSKDSLCEKFAWGPVSKCKLGQAAWILALIICLLFAVTVAFSIYCVKYYRKYGSMPECSVKDGEHSPVEDHDYSVAQGDTLGHHGNAQLNHTIEDETQFTHDNAEVQTHPSGPIAWNLQQPHAAPAELPIEPVDTSYHGGGHPYDNVPRPQSRPVHHYPANNARYHTHRPNESRVVGELPTPTGGGPLRHDLTLEYGHSGYGGSGTVSFPAGDYSR